MTEPDYTTWKTIDGFENYQVCPEGFVRRAVTNKYHPHVRVLKNANDSDGYQVVTLYANGKQLIQKVHRLVARVFIGPCPDGIEVNHRNGIKSDNRVENLEYVTPQQNRDHAKSHNLLATGDRNAMRKYPGKSQIGQWVSDHPEAVRGESNVKAKLTDDNVREIRRLSAEGIQTLTVARQFNVTTATIRDIKYGRRWTHLL